MEAWCFAGNKRDLKAGDAMIKGMEAEDDMLGSRGWRLERGDWWQWIGILLRLLIYECFPVENRYFKVLWRYFRGGRRGTQGDDTPGMVEAAVSGVCLSVLEWERSLIDFVCMYICSFGAKESSTRKGNRWCGYVGGEVRRGTWVIGWACLRLGMQWIGLGYIPVL